MLTNRNNRLLLPPEPVLLDLRREEVHISLTEDNFCHQVHFLLHRSRYVARILQSVGSVVLLIRLLALPSCFLELFHLLIRLTIIIIDDIHLLRHLLAQCHAFEMVQLLEAREGLLILYLCSGLAQILVAEEIVLVLVILDLINELIFAQLVRKLIIYVGFLEVGESHPVPNLTLTLRLISSGDAPGLFERLDGLTKQLQIVYQVSTLVKCVLEELDAAQRVEPSHVAREEPIDGHGGLCRTCNLVAIS